MHACCYTQCFPVAVAHASMCIRVAQHTPSSLTLDDDVCSVGFASACLRKLPHAGGNGKQIFGDAWWLEPEDDARLAAELAGAHAQGLNQSAAFTAAKASLGAQGDASSHAWKYSKLRQHATETVNLHSPYHCRQLVRIRGAPASLQSYIIHWDCIILEA